MRRFLTLVLLLIFQFSFSQYKETLIPYKKKDSWGFSDINRNIVIEPVYDTVHYFDWNDLAKVYKNKSFGFINKQGKKIVPIELSHSILISDSLYIVQKKDKYGIIDKNGNELLKPDFQHIERTNGDFFLVKQNDLIGVYRFENGIINPIVDILYQNIIFQYYEERISCVKDENLYVYDLKGQIVEERKLESDFEEEFEADIPFYVPPENKYPRFETISKKKLKGLIIRARENNSTRIRTDTIHAKYDSINPEKWKLNCFVVKRKINGGLSTVMEKHYLKLSIQLLMLNPFS